MSDRSGFQLRQKINYKYAAGAYLCDHIPANIEERGQSEVRSDTLTAIRLIHFCNLSSVVFNSIYSPS